MAFSEAHDHRLARPRPCLRTRPDPAPVLAVVGQVGRDSRCQESLTPLDAALSNAVILDVARENVCRHSFAVVEREARREMTLMSFNDIETVEC